MAPPVRSTFPVTLTASTWESVIAQASQRAANRRGYVAGAKVARLSNAEALQLVRAASISLGRARMPLWYQFAAVAFGWDPATDTLDTSAAQGAKLYPPDATVELWSALGDAAEAAQADPDAARPSLYFDDAWTDPLYAADVRVALQGDGATAAFKIPLPACKDPKTGKPTGKPYKDPKTGKWRCDPVVVDDPVTFAGKQFGTVALLLLGAWLVFGKKPRRRNRRS
jgi:hypothetical protein